MARSLGVWVFHARLRSYAGVLITLGAQLIDACGFG